MADELKKLSAKRDVLRVRAISNCEATTTLFHNPTMTPELWDQVAARRRTLSTLRSELKACDDAISPLLATDLCQQEAEAVELYIAKFDQIDCMVIARRRAEGIPSEGRRELTPNPPINRTVRPEIQHAPPPTNAELPPVVEQLEDGVDPPDDTLPPPVPRLLPNGERQRQHSGSNGSIASDSTLISPAFKIPACEIQPFSGERKQWHDFWGQFYNAVGSKINIPSTNKLQFLRSLLKGEAWEIIQEYELKEGNYDKAVKELNDEYGDPKQLKRQLRREIQNLKPLNDNAKAKRIRSLASKVSLTLNALAKVDKDVEDFLFQVKDLFPANIVALFPYNQPNGQESTLKDLFRHIRRKVKEEEEREAMRGGTTSDGSDSDDGDHDNLPTAASLVINNGTAPTTSERSRPRQFCIFCDVNAHWSRDCMAELSIKEKEDILKIKGRCLLCYKKKHVANECTFNYNECERCKGKHFLAMCPRHPYAMIRSQEPVMAPLIVMHSTAVPEGPADVLLQTVELDIFHLTSHVQILGLLDSGSQRSFVTQDVIDSLQIPAKVFERLRVEGFAAKNTQGVFPSVNLQLKSPHTNKTITINTLSVPHITNYTSPTRSLHLDGLQKDIAARRITLADQRQPGRSRAVKLVIGADFLNAVVTGDRIAINSNMCAYDTIFGWTVQGPLSLNNHFSPISCNISTLSSEDPLQDDITKLWKLETLGIVDGADADVNDDISAEESFRSSTNFDGSQYTVCLPWKSSLKHKLASNRDVAACRFRNMVRKLLNNELLFQQYSTAITTYIEDGHADLVSEDLSEESETIYYLPHRPVIDENRSTKVRIVFDASAHAANELSLNDCLYSGENRSIDMLRLLLQFRLGQAACTSDMRKAFLQIKIHPKDQDALRFFWIDQSLPREQWANRPKIYRMNRVIFGMTCSPFLLNQTILEHCAKLRTRPHIDLRAINTLANARYVDDVIFSEKDSHLVTSTLNNISSILQTAGFELHKIVKSGDRIENGSTSVLGMTWDPYLDAMQVKIPLLSILEGGDVSKRIVIRRMASIFDPLGLLSPVTLRPKLLLQEAWQRKLLWDEPLPADLKREWYIWLEELQSNTEWSIQRYIAENSANNSSDGYLHVFADASPKAFGCVAYYVYQQSDGDWQVSLLMAKSRVTPIKKRLTLPQLELLAATVASRTASYLSTTMGLADRTYLWSDSSIALDWIWKPSRKMGTFVENRVKEIRQRSKGTTWSHCTGEENPADLTTKTRKNLHEKLQPTWWKGPAWLATAPEEWPESKAFFIKEITNLNITTAEPTSSLFSADRFRSFQSMVRVANIVLSAIAKMRKRPPTPPDNENSHQQAEIFLLKESQMRWYNDIISSITNQKDLHKVAQSNIRLLLPFMDADGIIRIQGRLQYSILPYDERHPIILHPDDATTKLIIKSTHERLLHAGVSTTLATLRQRFWITAGRRTCAKVLRSCLPCERYYRSPIVQPEAPLPLERTQLTSPFLCTGLDFAGPVHIKSPIKSLTTKAYIAVFTCAASRAVHLELVSDMTTEKFLLSFRRFLNRRGTPSVIYSDNAKQFKRASNDLSTLQRIASSEETQSFVAARNISWRFIVERAPWWGGFWERMIRTIKTPLRKTLHNHKFQFEEFQTLLTDVEAVINSRPIAALTSDTDDFQPLTPAHILHGGPLISLTPAAPPAYASPDVIATYNQRKRVFNSIIKKWRELYLLQLRSAYLVPKRPISLLTNGQIVLLTEPAKPPHLWQLARIISIIKGRDGIIRSCHLRLSNGKQLRRPVNLLVPLENVIATE